MSLVKYNNNSISAVTSAAAIPSGAMVLIKTLTASSSATLSFVDGSSDVVLDNTYPIYVFKYIGIHPATDNASLTFQGSTDGGSNYNTTITSTLFQAYHKEDDSGPNVAYSTYDQAQGTAFQIICQGIGNANDENGSGYLYLFNPSSTTFVKHFIGRGSNYHYQDYAEDENAAGYFNTTSAIDAIQFKMSSGTFDGKIKLYGIKDS